jgi:endogenous inhibitor of DNA gyrase (YacG/DUF329 family)
MGKLIYLVNENFFRSWNDKMAYVLGFTFADGSLYATTISWEIQKRDREILEKINKAMNSNYPIKPSKKKRYVRLRISNSSIINDLRKFGLSLKKNKRKFPDVPDAYLRDFIRGVLDGDGWISIRKGGREVCIGLSGNYGFLKKLSEKLRGKLNLSTNNLRRRRRITKKGKLTISCSIEWYGRNASKVIRFLYDNLSKTSLFLNRKFIKQQKARKIFEKIKRMTREDVEERFGVPIKMLLKQLLYERKAKIAQIAKELGVRSSTIYEWVKKSGLKLPKKRKKYSIVECPICGRRFKKYNTSKKYCSLACAISSRLTGKTVNCIVCNKQIYRPAWWFKRNKYPICSRECQGKWKKILLEKGVLKRSKDTGRFLPAFQVVK